MLFTSEVAVTVANGRFTLAPEIVQTVEGEVRTGADRNKTSYLVHVPKGRSVESISLHAVADAIVGGLIPYGDLVAEFKRQGKLDKLSAAIKGA